jgi:CRP-like cAMP-binding protein
MKKLQPHPPISHPLLEASPELWAGVASTLRKKSYEEEDRIVSHGDMAVNLWLVLSGWVKLTRQTPDGKETIVELCTEGDVFGEAALFPESHYPYTANVVSGGTELLAIPATMIRSLVATQHTLAVRVMTLLNEHISQAQLKLEHRATMSAAQRLGCFLLRLCQVQQAEDKKTLQMPIEKHILAAYLGMKPETFSRAQQQLKPLGIAVSGQTITVNSIAKLRMFVCNSCSQSGSCDVEVAG